MAAIAFRRSAALSAGASTTRVRDSVVVDSVVVDSVDCVVTVMLRSFLAPDRRAGPMFAGPGVGQVACISSCRRQ
jgi:hypothetical protein